MPRPYELMVLISPEVGDEALDAEIERVSGIITDQDAEITFLKRDTPWGRRRLAYQIDRFRDAFYILYRFIGPAQAVGRIERELQLDERVIRYLVVRSEAAPQAEEEAEGQQEQSALPSRATEGEHAPEEAVASVAVPHESAIPAEAQPSTVEKLTDPNQTPEPEETH